MMIYFTTKVIRTESSTTPVMVELHVSLKTRANIIVIIKIILFSRFDLYFTTAGVK
jgi:hypothetical protein